MDFSSFGAPLYLWPYRECNTSDSETVTCLVIISILQDNFMQKTAVLHHDSNSKQQSIKIALYRKINSVVQWSETVMPKVFAMKSATKERHLS